MLRFRQRPTLENRARRANSRLRDIQDEQDLIIPRDWLRALGLRLSIILGGQALITDGVNELLAEFYGKLGVLAVGVRDTTLVSPISRMLVRKSLTRFLKTVTYQAISNSIS